MSMAKELGRGSTVTVDFKWNSYGGACFINNLPNICFILNLQGIETLKADFHVHSPFVSLWI